MMKKTVLCLLTVFMLLTPLLAQAEILELPLDFSAGMRPLWDYPAKRKTTQYDYYEDPSITAVYESGRAAEWKVNYYLARIKIANGTQIRTESAAGFEKQKGTAPTQTMARRVNAVVAINGDYYTGNAGRYVLRQGQVFRDAMEPNQDLLLIDEDGDFHIILADEHPEEMDKTTIDGKKVYNAICFGPALIRDGEIVADASKAQPVSHPTHGEQRIAICQTGPHEYLVVTIAHWGMTLEGFARFVYSLGGIQQAYNLDGGNSCHLVFMGNWRNMINTNGQDYRLVPDIIYFASAWKED